MTIRNGQNCYKEGLARLTGSENTAVGRPSRALPAEPLPFFDNPILRKFLGKDVLPDEVLPLPDEPGFGMASGVIISSDGYIVTNYHVVEQAGDIRVLLADQRDFKAQVIGMDPMTDLIAMTCRGIARIQERVKEIADVVKGSAHPPQFTACELDKLVDSVLDSLRLYADERGIVLRTQGPDGLPIVRADEQHLFNAFYNIVNNAIPEVPSGSFVSITGEVTPDGKEIILIFEDSGRGMTPEVLQSLLTYKVISRKVGGTGLVKKLLRMLWIFMWEPLRLRAWKAKEQPSKSVFPKMAHPPWPHNFCSDHAKFFPGTILRSPNISFKKPSC